MRVTDINQHLKPPADSILVRADVRQGWFVLTYKDQDLMTEIFCNQDGREVYRVSQPRPRVVKRVVDWLKEIYADPDTSTQV